MTLTADLWKNNRRLQSASNNAPSMRPRDTDAAAVRLLQQGLIDTGFMHLRAPTGHYLAETSAAVVDVEQTFNLVVDIGVAGRQVLGVLDLLLQGKRPETGGRSGASLAEADIPGARGKVAAALAALRSIRGQVQRMLGGASVDLDAVTSEALSLHFKLLPPGVLSGVRRGVTIGDLDLIIRTYGGIDNVMFNSATTFRSGSPVNGLSVPAEAPLGGPITFGPAYADFDTRFGKRIGPNSRMAIIIHEATHVVDGVSGAPNIHISEFDAGYAVQPPDLALHNPSAYAAFAAHVVLRRDPNPRFGLGAGRGQ